MDMDVLRNADRFEAMAPGQDYVGIYQLLDADQGHKEVEHLRDLREKTIKKRREFEEEYEARTDRANLEGERAEEARQRTLAAEVKVKDYDTAIYKANIGLEVARERDRVALQNRRDRGTKRSEPTGGKGTPVHDPQSRGRGSGSAGGRHIINEEMLNNAMGRLEIGNGGRNAQRPEDI